MPSRAHDRSHFYKYTSLDTAIQVISSKSFRWSSPTKFNDPFDHQTGFVVNYAPDELAKHLAAAIERVVFSEEDPKVDPRSLFSALALKLREIRHKLPREKVLESLQQASIECSQRLESAVKTLNDETQKHLCHSRVFCVSELLDNAVMWSHYADEHRGVVFKLKCVDEIDNTLLAARKVNYQNAFLPFPAAEMYVKYLTGERFFDWADLIWDLAHTKHQDWAYEREWRVHMALLDEPPGDGYDIFPENPRVFDAIYLGCRMGDEEIKVAVDAVKTHLPDMSIFLCKKSPSSFSLSFIPV